jgi:hypothetical protein
MNPFWKGPGADQLSRRQVLSGTLGAAAIGVTGSGTDAPGASNPAAGPRKRLLLIFLSGGASQLETWDPKPDASTGGPFRAIPTSVPGVHISELLPSTARMMHRLAVMRGVNTKIPDHFLGHYVLQSGRTVPGYPALTSVAARLLERPGDVLPGCVTLRRAAPQAYTDIGDAGFLGARYEPIRVIDGQAPENLLRPPSITPESAQAQDLLRRRADERFRRGRAADPVEAYGSTFEKAAALMRRRDLFDLDREPARLRERYGQHILGRNCLLARRLLEAGVSCVKVVHHDWDAHNDNFHWQQVRCGELDQSFPALFDDLEARGLLADTLIVIMGEMGRTPKINNRLGRDHWGNAWSVALAGCGVREGVVHGRTNADGTAVADGEVDAAMLFHTFLRALGLDPNARHQVNGQRIPIGDPAGVAIREVLA